MSIKHQPEKKTDCHCLVRIEWSDGGYSSVRRVEHEDSGSHGSEQWGPAWCIRLALSMLRDGIDNHVLLDLISAIGLVEITGSDFEHLPKEEQELIEGVISSAYKFLEVSNKRREDAAASLK